MSNLQATPIDISPTQVQAAAHRVFESTLNGKPISVTDLTLLWGTVERKRYDQEAAAQLAFDLMHGANDVPKMHFIRHGVDVAWYDGQLGTYKAWEQGDRFDSIVLALTPSLHSRNRFDRDLIRFLYVGAPEPAEPPINKINTLSGIIVFNGRGDWTFEPHSPDFHSVVQIPHKFEPDNQPEPPEHIPDFLRAVLSKEITQTFHEMVGLLCLPHTRLEKAFVLRGSGANGKSTAMRLIRELVGKDNSVSIPLTEITGQFGAIKLQGKLVNLMTEVDFKKLDNSALFKQIVSGEEIYGQDKGKTGYNFTPFARMVMALDNISGISDVSVGFQRRLEVLDFPNQFMEGKRNIYLHEDLTTPWELEGYFFHYVIPALTYIMANDRLSPVLDKFGQPRRLQTAIDQFVEARLEFAPSVRISRKHLNEMANAWQGEDKEFTIRQLYRWLEARQCRTVHTQNERFFEGVKER